MTNVSKAHILARLGPWSSKPVRAKRVKEKPVQGRRRSFVVNVTFVVVNTLAVLQLEVRALKRAAPQDSQDPYL